MEIHEKSAVELGMLSEIRRICGSWSSSGRGSVSWNRGRLDPDAATEAAPWPSWSSP